MRREHLASVVRALSVSCTIAFVIALAICQSTFAQTVTWGVNGVGGSGTWNTTTANWYNGTTNVPWPSSGNAIFAGATGGTVNVFGFPVVSSMTFNTPGYSVQGSIGVGSSGLTVTTNVNAAIGASFVPVSFPAGTLTKNGPATLSLVGSTSLPVQVNQGELDASGSFSTVNLANAPGVIVTLDSSSPVQMGSLTGGGSAGGLVQPANKPETMTLSLNGNSTFGSAPAFGGTVADNGAGVLALDYQGPSSQTLTGVNTYSGPTTIESGGLKLTGNGSITSTSSISISPGATLELDDSGTLIGNRLSTTAPIMINGGTLKLDANTTMPVNESAGPLQFAGVANILVTQPVNPGPPVQLSFAGLTRVGHGVLSINGPGVSFAGLANGSTGIVAPYVTVGGDWATVGADGRSTAFAAYVPDINTASATDNVRLIPDVVTTLAASSTVGSLNMASPTQVRNWTSAAMNWC